MILIVRDLLILAKFGNDAPEDLPVVDANDIARSALEIVGCERVIFHAVEQRALFSCEADAVRRALVNLLENALRHTTACEMVALSCQTAEKYVRFIVEDTGEGIPPEDVARVFDRFYQVDRSRSRDHGGTGLGLAVVKSIVEHHKGTIDMTSEHGKGTTVALSFPKFDAL